MSTNVGLVTTRLSATPSPSATARTRCVLPAPSGPTRATTAPGKRRDASRRPNASVAARSGSSMTVGVWFMGRFAASGKTYFPVTSSRTVTGKWSL